jgi:hypothetical protein
MVPVDKVQGGSDIPFPSPKALKWGEIFGLRESLVLGCTTTMAV